MTADEEKLLAAGWVKAAPCARCKRPRGWSTGDESLCELCHGALCQSCCDDVHPDDDDVVVDDEEVAPG